MQGRKIILLILFVTLGTMATAQRCNTLKIQIGLLQKKYNVHFIYNSDLKLDVPYQGPALYYKLLPDNLDLLFKNTEIDWKLSEHNISLFKRNKPKKTKIYTICGYIRDINKESLISATIYDHTSKNGTITNEYGFFSLSLPEGKHTLKISYVGYDDKNIDINLNGNHDVNIIMTENNTFDDVIVNGDLNSPLLNTQTGKRTLSSKDLNTEFSLLSSPDVIKTLQRISGVSEGIELASGLYVHGGGNDENLFLLDGTPLYQINHSLGLFSSFNTDIVKNVDFYKSGFPAHYNGRLSSITDIRTIDGNMKHTHGAYSIGLLDGRLFLEGPVVKDKTSYVFGLRRSWLDLFLHPTFALMNKSNKDGDHTSFDYLFHDLNIKITHIFSYKSKIYISLYSGKDKYSIRDKSVWSSFFSDTNNDFNWGNFNVALNWNYQISHKMFMNISEIYSNSHSIHDYSEDETQHRDNIIKRTSLDIQHNRSKIYDMGIKTNFDYRPNSKNRILFGGNYTCHIFNPTFRFIYIINC